MWDLDTLSYLNEQAHQRAVERAQEGSQTPASEVQAAAPVYPLAKLARLLVTGPPSIAHLVDLLENSEIVTAFMELVCEYLPDREEEIGAAVMDDRIRLFSHYFGQRYFPLSERVIDYELEEFIGGIPVDLMGFSYDDFHEFTDFRTGYILLLSLIESPFSNGDSNGGRVPIISHVSDLLGGDVAALIPKDGWTPKQLHELTDETKFKGVGVFADWVHSQTDCWVLDANYYDYEGEPWYPDSISSLTTQWPRVCQIQDEFNRVVEYIEENLKKRFLELLDILLDVNTNEFVVPAQQLHLPLGDTAQVTSM